MLRKEVPELFIEFGDKYGSGRATPKPIPHFHVSPKLGGLSMAQKVLKILSRVSTHTGEFCRHLMR